MGWIEKERPTPFDTQPIDGLFFVDGNYQDRTRHTPWSQGKKRPTIVFPSGAHCDLSGHPEPDNATVDIFVALKIPLVDTHSQAFADAQKVARAHWYEVEGIDDHRFIVTCEAENAVIVYDPVSHRLRDVTFIRNGEYVPYAVSDILDDTAHYRLGEGIPPNPLALDTFASVCYDLPHTDWVWYATGFDGKDTFYGLVVENTIACATFSLTDLARLRGPYGSSVQQDYDFEPLTLGELKALHERLRHEEKLLIAVPTNWVAKEDLLSVRPDLKRRIQALTENDLSAIADKVGDALSESYWIALPIILASYLGVAEVADYEDGEETEDLNT
ncbi:MAG: hypothetical protein ACYDBJ_24245 [Aggregatilineales bacterium]